MRFLSLFRYVIHYWDGEPHDLKAVEIKARLDGTFTLSSSSNGESNYNSMSELIQHLKDPLERQKALKDRPKGVPLLIRCLRPSEFDITPNLVICSVNSR